jgi:hypothetical protein
LIKVGLVVCATTPGAGHGRDVTCALPRQSPAEVVSPMKNFVAPLGFTLLSVWVVMLFVLAHSTP